MESSSSYFEHSIGGLIPQSDQQAFKIAFYNSVAFVFVLTIGVLLLSIYHLLVAFFKPIIWAILCGTVLFPFKKTVANGMQRWLDDLNHYNTPFLLGLVLIPFRILDKCASGLWKLLSSKDVLIFVGGYVLIRTLAMQNVSEYCFDVLSDVYSLFDNFIQLGAKKWMLRIALIYLLIFAGYLYLEGPNLRKKPVRFLSVPIWTVILCQVADLFGILRMPVFVLSSTVILLILIRVISTNESGSVSTSAAEIVDHSREEMLNRDDKSESSFSAAAAAAVSSTSMTTDNMGNRYIKIVIGGCCLVWISNSPIFLIIFIIVLVYAVLKKFGEYFGICLFFYGIVVSTLDYFRTKFGHIFDILIPSSIRKFAKLIYHGDQKILDSFRRSAGILSSIIVMIGLLLTTVLLSTFFVFQIRNEVAHLFQLSGNLLNRTITSSPDYADWITNASSNLIGDSQNFDSLLDDAFKHGRTWLGSQARLLAKPDDIDKADQLEAQVKMLVDRLYEAYMTKNAVILSKETEENRLRQQGTMDIWSHIKLSTDLTLLSQELTELVKENIGMLLSILDTVWTVLRSNVQFIFSLLAATFGIVLSLGLEVLNFTIGILIFLTMIYYLLTLSEDQWKPIEWLMTLTPNVTIGHQNSKSFTSTLEQAVSGVFILSFKMAIFYGLYAYFIHALFSLNVVFIPSILASLFAVVPFLAPYWVFMPGALELYLVRGQMTLAILFVVSSLAPMMFVDATFYQELKGSHPYLTGLSVVGGIYWLGLEGALIGPMLLCCMLVTLNMYKNLLPKAD